MIKTIRHRLGNIDPTPVHTSEYILCKLDILNVYRKLSIFVHHFGQTYAIDLNIDIAFKKEFLEHTSSKLSVSIFISLYLVHSVLECLCLCLTFVHHLSIIHIYLLI